MQGNNELSEFIYKVGKPYEIQTLHCFIIGVSHVRQPGAFPGHGARHQHATY